MPVSFQEVAGSKQVVCCCDGASAQSFRWKTALCSQICDMTPVSVQGVQSGPGTSIQIFEGTDLVTKPVAGAHFLTFNKGDVVRVVVNNLPANANGESCHSCSTDGLPWVGTVVHAGQAKSLATAC